MIGPKSLEYMRKKETEVECTHCLPFVRRIKLMLHWGIKNLFKVEYEYTQPFELLIKDMPGQENAQHQTKCYSYISGTRIRLSFWCPLHMHVYFLTQILQSGF